MSCLKFSPNKRAELLSQMNEGYEAFAQASMAGQKPLLPEWDKQSLSMLLGELDLVQGMEASLVLTKVQAALEHGTLNFHHPKYHGVFNPMSADMGALANYLVSLYNPQLASTKSAPFPITLEQYLIQFFGKLAGFEQSEGNFTTGGTEANITAVLCALNHRFPSYGHEGLLGLKQRPIVYVSSETHHSFQKAVKVLGLGLQSIREVPCNHFGQMEASLLSEMIEQDLLAGHVPCMLVATLGTTSSGAIDDISALATLSELHGLWLHVDAAYGGATLLIDPQPKYVSDLKLAHSFCVDAHKWLAQPFGVSLLVTREQGILRQAFATEGNVYMPKDSEQTFDYEPYRDSMQWSRRFMGLGLFMHLATMGHKGLSQQLQNMMSLADEARQKLTEGGFEILNQSPFPVICFTHPAIKRDEQMELICAACADQKQGFLTTTYLTGLQQKALRVSINNSVTDQSSLSELIAWLLQQIKP